MRTTDFARAGQARLRSLFVVLLASSWLIACSGDNSNTSEDATITDSGGGDQLEVDAALPDAGQDAPVAPDQRPDLPPPKLPELGNLTLYANLGDSIAYAYGASVGYRDLLMQNDDDAYPEFEGKDFATRFPDIQLGDRSLSGATSADVVEQSKLVPANTTGTTLVIISAGGNDILNNYTALLDPTKVKAIAKELTDNLELTMQTFSDKSKFPEPVHFAILNIYDLTDGTGLIADDEPVINLCASVRALGPVIGKKLVDSLAVLNDELAAFVAAKGAMLVDIHEHFLGHGFNYKDDALPEYDPDDPTLWYQYDCLHPTERGHHEIRRVIWKRLFGE